MSSLLYGTLTPAYGRRYKSGEDALADWNAGRDFRINNPRMSTFCSVRDADDCPAGHTLQIRWGRRTEAGVITKQADGSWTGSFDGAPRPTPAQDASRERDSMRSAIYRAVKEHITDGGLVTSPDTLVDRIFEALSEEE